MFNVCCVYLKGIVILSSRPALELKQQNYCNKTRIEKLSTQLFPVLWISAADLSRTWGKPNNVYLCYLKCKIKSFVTQICSPPTKSPRLRNLPLSNNCKATVKFFRKKHWALTHQKEDLHSRIEWNQLGYLLCDEIIKELIMKKHFSTKNKFACWSRVYNCVWSQCISLIKD